LYFPSKFGGTFAFIVNWPEWLPFFDGTLIRDIDFRDIEILHKFWRYDHFILYEVTNFGPGQLKWNETKFVPCSLSERRTDY
jgi:hypothetical protein